MWDSSLGTQFSQRALQNLLISLLNFEILDPNSQFLISSGSWFNWWFPMFLWSKFDSNPKLVYWIAYINFQFHNLWSSMHDFKYCIYYIANFGWFDDILWSHDLIDYFKIYYSYYNVELKFCKGNLRMKLIIMILHF